MKKYLFAGFAAFFLATFCAFYQKALLPKKYCLENGLDCITASGGWEIIPIMSSDNYLSLFKYKYLFFGEKVFMETYFLSEEAISINFKNKTSSNVKLHEFGEIETIRIAPEKEKYSSLRNFFGGNAYSTEKGIVIKCDNPDCLDSIRSLSRKS